MRKHDITRDTTQLRPHGFASERRKSELSTKSQGKVRWPVLLLLLALFVPWTIQFGALRLSPYRLILLVMLLPCLFLWLSGSAGKMRKVDFLVLASALWCCCSLVVNHGLGLAVQPAGIIFLESVGSYLVARCYIRSADDFYRLLSLLFKTMLVMWPFALLEMFGHPVWRDMFATVWPIREMGGEPPRFGLHRVRMGFDHPILFGVCVAALVAPAYLVLGFGKLFLQRAARAACVGGLAMMSISAGALIVILVQAMLLLWNDIFRQVRQRWKILVVISVTIIVAIELVANRPSLTIVVSWFVFDSDSYWYRLLIWNYGTESVANNPLFGTGLDDWERPSWMPASIDNFWLFSAVRYGLPAPILIGLAALSTFQALSSRDGLDERHQAYRTAILISIFALCVAAWTVAFWDASYVLFLFLLGSGIWILDESADEKAMPELRGAARGRRTEPRVRGRRGAA